VVPQGHTTLFPSFSGTDELFSLTDGLDGPLFWTAFEVVGRANVSWRNFLSALSQSFRPCLFVRSSAGQKAGRRHRSTAFFSPTDEKP